MMKAYTFKYLLFIIQEKSFIRIKFNLTDAYFFFS